ncbi:MAG: RnfABCDGE type electron transport complex subunit D [Gammaproteobacteria bacterium]|nr:RnfABCDGE type electron transport complex subunit D [Gammaproteobacteria bacterium]
MAFIAALDPRVKHTRNVSSIMCDVILALLPGTALYVWWFGFGVLVQICLAIVTALVCEAIVCGLRRKPMRQTLGDLSAIVTAWLLALCIPSLAPWWLIVSGTAFAVVLVKHAYGGLGTNIFNPAMAGYAALLISFPVPMTQWPGGDAATLDLAACLAVIGANTTALDGLTAATALDYAKTQLLLERGFDAMRGEPVFGTLASNGWEWIAVGHLGGGLWLLWRGVIRWQIPAAMLAALLLSALLFHLLDAQRYASPLFHLFAGATVLGAFFIATDPVTAATSPRGRLVFATGIGALVYVIRTWGGYPDGVAFAVLVMNMAAPAIDYFAAPRVLGTGSGQS